MATGQEATIPNSALKPFGVLIGFWRTQGTHPMTPGVTYHGRTMFEWIEGGAFLIMRSETDEPQIPSGFAILGSDDTRREFYMLYFDERGVSRKLDVTLKDNVWTWWRDGPDMSQRFNGTISPDGREIVGKGMMKKKGGDWEGDLSLTYTRED